MNITKPQPCDSNDLLISYKDVVMHWALVYSFMELKMYYLLVSYLKVGDDFAKSLSKKPGLCDINHKTRGQTYDGDQNISQGEVYYEVVGHCPHVTIFPHCKTN